MSNQELTEWISTNREQLGINVPDGTTSEFVDEFVMFDRNFGKVICNDALCGGAMDSPTEGVYLGGQISLFRPAFTPGPLTYPFGEGETIGIRLIRHVSREAHAVQVFGHEAAHARGIDLDAGNVLHVNAERFGIDAMRRFQSIYEHR